MDFNTPPAPQGHALPEQYGYPVGAHGAPYPHYGYPSLDLGSTLTQGPTRQLSSQGPLGSYHPSRLHASAYDSSGIPACGSQYPSGYPHLYHPPQSQAQAHDSESESPSRDSPTQPAGAPASTHLATPVAAPNENGALLSNSYAQAAAARDRSFRSPLQLADDDVDEVVRDKRKHVLSIVNALKHDDCLPPPDNRKGPHVRKGVNAQQGAADRFIDLTDNDKLRWRNWQDKAKQVVKVNLSQPNSGIYFEFRAWEILEEMITIHRAGYLFTKQTTDAKMKCSERIEKAVEVLKDYAIARSKLLDGQNISNFCNSPEAYVRTTISALWNNSNRPDKRKAGDTVPPGPKAAAKPATEKGTISYRYQPRPRRHARKSKKPVKSKVDDAISAESSIEPESPGAVLNDSRLDSSPYADNDEECDQGEGEGQAEDNDEAEDDDDNGEVIGGRDTERVRRILSGRQPSGFVVSSSFDTENLGENLFGSLPGETRPLGQLDLDESSYPAHLGATHTSMNSYSQSPEDIRTLSGTYGPPSWEAYRQGAGASRTMLLDSPFDDGLSAGADSLQHNMRPPRGPPSGPPRRYPRATEALSGFPTDMPGQSWRDVPGRGSPHSQDQQENASKTRASKKRKL